MQNFTRFDIALANLTSDVYNLLKILIRETK